LPGQIAMERAAVAAVERRERIGVTGAVGQHQSFVAPLSVHSGSLAAVRANASPARVAYFRGICEAFESMQDSPIRLMKMKIPPFPKIQPSRQMERGHGLHGAGCPTRASTGP
jgi:hypothetical protein